MSLAEQKKKQRIVADPQNKKWAEDKSGFGFKMLQKMGWKEGSGLGASGEGQSEHIKVTLKTDSSGIGADKKSLSEDSSGHLESFEEILKKMNSQAGGKSEKTSKTERRKRNNGEKGAKSSKDSKKSIKEKKGTKFEKGETNKKVEKESKVDRLAHRKKFRNSKNVSQYSESQLKEIFGV